MSSLLSAELAATCNALGYYDTKSGKYYADSNTLETVKDLIRYLRRDDDTHDIRRQLGESKVLQTDLLPLMKSYWEETELFDVLLRLLVNLTTPALMLWNEEPPKEKTVRNYYLQIEGHLEDYKQAFADETVWAVLSTRISKILEIDYTERGDENSLIIERILILIRNVLYVIPDPNHERRTDNDASIHDQVLWALHQSNMLDIILFLASSPNERAYYMHTLEILSFMLREQNPAELASAALQRSELEKIRDEAELLAIRHRENDQRKQKMKMYSGSRHSRFGGTYVLTQMKSISDNELIYHKPLNKLDALDFDSDKKKLKTPKNRLPVKGTTLERRSAFSVRLFLKEFCVEFLNGAYNTLMYHVKDNLVRAKAQAHDESYYLWALRFFMEFNRRYKFEVKLVSETMSLQSFHYVQQQMENYFDVMQTDKSKTTVWSRRLHLALAAYRELLLTLCAMDKSVDAAVRDSAKVIKSNIFYVPEYRELVIALLLNYDELKMSNAYLNDLMETQHVFIKMLQSFCDSGDALVVAQRKKNRSRKKGKKAKAGAPTGNNPEGSRSTSAFNLENIWEETSPQLSSVLETNSLRPDMDVVPFDAASDVPIDEQKSETMRKVQRKLRNNELEEAVALLRAAREVWPENDCFGSSDMPPEEEFLALREIFFAELGGVVEEPAAPPAGVEEADSDNGTENEDEDDEEEQSTTSMIESDFRFTDFTKRLCNPKIVRACGLALKNFETNPINSNQCIVKLLHRIAFDCKMYVMVFQVSLFRTFQKIFDHKSLPQYKELVRFATFIVRKFIDVAEKNKLLFMETLFWKNSSEAYEIEHGYGSHAKSVANTAWTEEQEDELRTLFVEHQENKVEEDVVDWIVGNLIDNTRTRRIVLHKLKQLHLLVNYKRSKKPGVKSQTWSEDEVEQLRVIFEEVRDRFDPISILMEHLPVQRSKNKIIEKLLELGLIQDKREVAKKGRKSNAPGGDPNGNDSDSDGEDSDEDQGPRRGPQKAKATNNQPKPGTFSKKASNKKKSSRKPTSRILDGRLTKLLLEVMESDLEEAVRWLQESFSDAMEDFEADEDGEGIPLVPIMDYAVDAMENAKFQQLLKALGITEPFDEQEMYWRIPGDLSLEDLRQRHDLLQQAIDKTLTPPTTSSASQPLEEETSTQNDRNNASADEDDDGDIFNQLRTFARQEAIVEPSTQEIEESIETSSLRRSPVREERARSQGNEEADKEENFDVLNRPSTSSKGAATRTIAIIDSDEDETQIENDTSQQQHVKERKKYVLSDADDEDIETKRTRNDSDSESGKPTPKRARRIVSSDEEDD